MRTLEHPRAAWAVALAVVFSAPLGATVASAAPAAAQPSATGSGSDWPAFLGPNGDARSTETGILTQWPEEGLRLLWYREVGEGYSAPAVAGGRLFHFDRTGDRARLVSLDRRTGTELWSREYPTDYVDSYGYSNGPRASPVVDGDRVYIYGVEGRLRCHRAGDGELLWEVDTVPEFGVVQNFFGVGATPVVFGDLLLVMVGGSPPESPKIHSGSVRPNGSAIVAFDKETGEVRYRTGDELASYSTPSLAEIGGRPWLLAFTRGGLLGLDPRSGRQDFFFPWRAKILESVNASKPVVAGDTVFLSETYGPGSALLRVRDGGYEVVWQDQPKSRNKAMRTHWNTAVHHDGFLYGSSGRGPGDAELRAVRLADGGIAWSRPGLQRATLLYADGHFLVLSESGELRLVEARADAYREVAVQDLTQLQKDDGQPLVRPPAWNAPILAHGILYVLGKDTLLALELIPPAGSP